ncbi:MAG: formate acetyltransferase [Desulfobacteraceae bacterium]|nr:formate acetyltransferase [Desulfobacteraceae bacterium]MBC2757977.1 formate acetyltransferase [Desulfobacteraceae bacterium]
MSHPEALMALKIAEKTSDRFSRIRDALMSEAVHLCPERALLITEYFKKHDDKKDPMVVRRAKALRYLLTHKTVEIWPDEWIVGNVGTKRKSAIIQPELAGVYMCEELLWVDKRKTAPHPISWSDRFKLVKKVIPYWLFRNMIFRAFKSHRTRFLQYVPEQLNATYYLINEVAGIGHFLPNYEKMIQLGIEGYLDVMKEMDGHLHKAAEIACEGLADYSLRLGEKAMEQAELEKDPVRAKELKTIAQSCWKVPLKPAESFHEALQSLWLTHMTVCLEGINSAVSFGRVDQYLYPYYQKDIAEGRLTPEGAFELLLSFSAKTTEHVFLISERTSQYHGGFLVAQAATIGGMDKDGKDAVNDLTYLFLDVMEHAGLRDPNYMARIHDGSPKEYIRRAVDVARKGNGVPGLFNDEVAVQSLVAHGFPLEEARNYGIVGCVEPSFPGQSFFSTDAALFNLPLCLVLAINQGRRLNARLHIGAKTPRPEKLTSMDAVLDAFTVQVNHMVARMISDMKIVEKGNRDYHPTPFSSMLVDGCIESGRDVTQGGALYNSSGVQGVGVADAADSLAALDELVFQQQKYSLVEIIDALRVNFNGNPKMQAELLNASKFGNDMDLPDRYAGQVARIFHDALVKFTNTRGGNYVPGYYSSTCHVGFGNRTEAFPSGRKRGEPFAASLGCSNGRDRRGVTALLNSVAKVDSTLAMNGYALNLRFDKSTLAGEKGQRVMTALAEGFFRSGGMEMQLNVLDPDMLEDAKENPGKYPGIVVRVAGFCAYFDDLPNTVKEEIIDRTRLILK